MSCKLQITLNGDTHEVAGPLTVAALLAQLLVLHEDVIHCIVLAVIVAAAAWTQREQLPAMRG